MKTTAMTTIDHAPQVVHEWVNELSHELTLTESGRALRLLRVTLHTLRDILPVAEAVDMSAQLPVLLRGIFFEGWNPSAVPAGWQNKADFIARVQEEFSNEPFEKPEKAISAVFALLRRKMSSGEIEQVIHATRKPLQSLWED